jgi:osmotically-inducible protein OsmY
MKNDLQIQKDVVAELTHDPNVTNGAIGVEVHHGVVKLAGRVSDATRKLAERDALRVAGVTSVVPDTGVEKR